MKTLGIALLAVVAVRAAADDYEDYRKRVEAETEPALASVSPAERAKARRELKRVEKRARDLGIFLNKEKMERLDGTRLMKVLADYDRFIGILEELPVGFVKACNINSVWFSDEIVDFEGNHAGGVASGAGIELPLGFGKDVVYHEMFHKFDGAHLDARLRREWEECNPREFLYTGSQWANFGSYKDKRAMERYRQRLAEGKERSVAEQRERTQLKRDRERIATNKTNETVQAAFINAYAQTTPGEDRAEVFRCMITEGPRFLERARRSEHMMKKMAFMMRVTGTLRLLGTDFWEEHADVARAQTADRYGGGTDGDWAHAAPETLGFDSKKLALIPRAIKKYGLGTRAMMVVVGGKVVFEYGAVSESASVSSCWPSLLSLLYGRYVSTEKIDLNATLESLEISDVGGLERRERSATVRDLVTSRSGCYHPAADAPAPKGRVRGSVLPGGHFVYNNWDFNVAAAVFEKVTEKSVAEAFSDEIARPLRFQDWDASAVRKVGDSSVSEHLAYDFALSVRDLAKVGQLMLRKGRWKGLQLVSPKWIEQSTSPVSKFPRGGGYGYMWWIEKEAQTPPVYKGAFSARGLNGQRLTVLPELDMVIAHHPARNSKRPMTGSDYRKLVYLVLSARLEE